MNPDCIVFDFTGTLADTAPVLVEVFNGLADKYRFRKLTEDNLNQMRGMGPLESRRLMGISCWKLPAIIVRFRSLLAARMCQVELIRPELRDILVQLHDAGCTLGIVTSNASDNVRRFTEANNIEIFDFIVTAGFFRKAGALRRVARQRAIDSDRMVYIGDETRDIEAARAAGIASAAVTWGTTQVDVLEAHNPDYVFADPDAILKALLS